MREGIAYYGCGKMAEALRSALSHQGGPHYGIARHPEKHRKADCEIISPQEIASIRDRIRYLFLTIPSSALSEAMPFIGTLDPETTIIDCVKGEHEMLPNSAVLSGPNFAADIMRGDPTGTEIAGVQASVVNDVMRLFEGSKIIRPYASNDPVSTLKSGILKNLFVLQTGMLMQQNPAEKAEIFAGKFLEMLDFAKKIGANPLHMLSLAGLGDYFLCNNSQSRNFALGQEAGQKSSLLEALDNSKKRGITIEAINTIRKFANKNYEEEWLMALVGLLNSEKNFKTRMADLMPKNPPESGLTKKQKEVLDVLPIFAKAIKKSVEVLKYGRNTEALLFSRLVPEIFRGLDKKIDLEKDRFFLHQLLMKLFLVFEGENAGPDNWQSQLRWYARKEKVDPKEFPIAHAIIAAHQGNYDPGTLQEITNALMTRPLAYLPEN